MTRSPVNSTNFRLRVAQHLRGWFGQASVQLYAARQVQMPVDFAFGGAHLQNDGVVDPIAGCVGTQGTVGNGGRKGKRGWIEPGKLEMKVHRVDIARSHGRKLETFARRVGAGKIEAHVIAHDESYDRKRNVFRGANADPDHNGGKRFQQMDGVTGEVEYSDPDDLGAA